MKIRTRAGLWAALACVSVLSAEQHQGFPSPKAAYVDPGDPAYMEKKFDAANEAQKNSLQERNDNFAYFESIKKAALMLLDEDQRRKSFVLISEGMALNSARIAAGGSGGFVEMGTIGSVDVADLGDASADVPNDMMKAMRRANVTMYAIDPRGEVRAEDQMLELWPPPDCAVCNSPPVMPLPQERLASREDLLDRRHNPIRIAQDGLTETAEAAGGFAITNTNDLTRGINRILEHVDHYYLLGFYPVDTGRPNDSHPVTVTVPGHPEYKVRFRRGYSPEPAPRERAANSDTLAELSAGVMPTSDLPLRLIALPLVGTPRLSSVAAELEITTPTGVLKDADAKLRDDVSYAVLVVDEKKAKVTSRVGRAARVSLSGKEGAGEMPDSVTYQIPMTLDLAPGTYQLRASAVSQRLGKGGSVYLSVTVPDFSAAPLAVSGIALGYAEGARVPVGRAAVEDAKAERVPFERTLSREFSRADTLRAYFEIARADLASTVTVELAVIDASGKTVLAIDDSVGPQQSGRIEMRVPLSLVGTGAFRLRATAAGSRATAQSETGFIIK